MRVKPSFAALLFVAAHGLPPGAVAQAPDDGCTTVAPKESVRLAGLDRHGDLLLDDGRTVRLAGLAPRQSEAERASFAAQIEARRGAAFGFAPVGGADRWGRIPARLLPLAAAAGSETELTVAMLAAGAALRLPEPGLAACNEIWRKAELQALARSRPPPDRSAATPANLAATKLPVVDGHDPAAMRAQAGRIVVVEGRIAAVGERTQRTYLNFERRRGAGGSVVLSRPLWRELQRLGWTASALAGKRVRVRGVVEGRDGLLIEPESRAALEMID